MLGKVMSMTGIKTTADKKAEKDANAEANKAACQALSQKEFEKIANEKLVGAALETVNAHLTTINEDILTESVKKIMVTICETIQGDPSLKALITTNVLEDMEEKIKKIITKEELKTYVIGAFLQDKELKPENKDKELKEPKEKETDYEQHDQDEYLWRSVDDEVDPKIPNFTEISNIDPNTLFIYYTDKICYYIKRNPGAVKMLIESVYKRFDKFFENKLIGHVTQLLEPIAKETREELRKRVIANVTRTGSLLRVANVATGNNSDPNNILNYFNLGDLEVLGITKAEADKIKTEKQDEIMAKNKAARERREAWLRSLMDAATSRILRGKAKTGNSEKKETCDAEKGPSLTGSLKAAIQDSGLKGGNKKTQIHKQIMRRHKTLKRKLRL
jgi:hypothetical protein